MKHRFEASREFWESKYDKSETGWDIGYSSPPISDYIDQIKNKALKILIPGAGNGYEVDYLYKAGFSNIYVIDIAKQPLNNLKDRIPTFPSERLILGDFFEHRGSYDLIIEQTFFCALHPGMRLQYMNHMHSLLSKNGKLTGLLFDFELTAAGPPYGGSKREYIKLFSSAFNIMTLERCYNSIKPRQGSELFFIFTKK